MSIPSLFHVPSIAMLTKRLYSFINVVSVFCCHLMSISFTILVFIEPWLLEYWFPNDTCRGSPCSHVSLLPASWMGSWFLSIGHPAPPYWYTVSFIGHSQYAFSMITSLVSSDTNTTSGLLSTPFLSIHYSPLVGSCYCICVRISVTIHFRRASLISSS